MFREHSVLNVVGISCERCVKEIQKAVGALNGVESVSADLETGKVAVEFDSELVTIDIIKDTIEDQGYNVK